MTTRTSSKPLFETQNSALIFVLGFILLLLSSHSTITPLFIHGQQQTISTSASPLPLSRAYQYNQSLRQDGTYDILWSIDESTQELYMALSVSTLGWIGFGFHSFQEMSSSQAQPQGMARADIVIGWKDATSGNAFIFDTYAVANSRPLQDTQLGGKLNVQLVASFEGNGRTILEFKRQLNTGDAFDVAIQRNKTLIAMYAYSASDPTNNDYNSLAFHSVYSFAMIPNFWPLMESVQNQSNMTNSTSWSVNNETMINGNNTLGNNTLASSNSSSTAQGLPPPAQTNSTTLQNNNSTTPPVSRSPPASNPSTSGMRVLASPSMNVAAPLFSKIVSKVPPPPLGNSHPENKNMNSAFGWTFLNLKFCLVYVFALLIVNFAFEQ
ncbi:hypothetical protein C9374_009451 [Naegleria lovaniensis]|uniref:DOMON domain-containing protein n=1 Tax=Naegleria lovaniensis TaxID=51637 RepID=A0AA88KRP9_NAELO|nr:uncharacterized protein C9374_009451 [Naegleria lovaniensis]KAG2392874.1 hypothetical protein C9374_009451 [Naegleria lovaniensis]